MSKLPIIIGISALLIVLGIFAWVTDAPAYMGHEPSTCANCHVMDAAYENWYHAAHEKYADCNDCHLPHQNIAVYYLYKGYSGMKDVYSFTTGSYPDAIRAEPSDRANRAGQLHPLPRGDGERHHGRRDAL